MITEFAFFLFFLDVHLILTLSPSSHKIKETLYPFHVDRSVPRFPSKVLSSLEIFTNRLFFHSSYMFIQLFFQEKRECRAMLFVSPGTVQSPSHANPRKLSIPCILYCHIAIVVSLSYTWRLSFIYFLVVSPFFHSHQMLKSFK